jgi:polygalacturonase
LTRSCKSQLFVAITIASMAWISGCSLRSAPRPSNGNTGGTESDASTTGGTGGTAGADAGFPTTCDDIGTEPTIPPPCATIVAAKTVTVIAAGAAGAGGGAGGTGAGGAAVAGAAGAAAGGRAGAGGAGGAAGSASVIVVSDEATLDTDRIQAAIDACGAGQSVRLATEGDKVAFVSGALFLKAGVTLWVDAGVTLYASRDPRDFDTLPGLCGRANASNDLCKALVNAEAGADGAGVMGQGTLDGRGGEPMAGDTLTWWQRQELADGSMAGPRLVQTQSVNDFTLYGLTMRNSPKFHVAIDDTDGFVVWGITIDTPDWSPNTDGVDPYGSRNGVFAYNRISTGDDNIAIKGSGRRTENLVIAHNHFGEGHGMSIGSETFAGVRNVRVCDLSLDSTDNGLRIKSDSSRGGLVQGISYTDVCIRDVRRPITIDPYYSSSTGTQIPDFRDVLIKNVHVLGGGRVRLKGYDAAHPLSVTLDNVVFDDLAATTIDAADAQITLGPGPVNLAPSGTNVTVTDQVTGTAAPRDCTDAW